jgi:hypothetical protein
LASSDHIRDNIQKEEINRIILQQKNNNLRLSLPLNRQVSSNQKNNKLNKTNKPTKPRQHFSSFSIRMNRQSKDKTTNFDKSFR